MRKLINNVPVCLKYAEMEIKDDANLVRSLIDIDPMALEFASYFI